MSGRTTWLICVVLAAGCGSDEDSPFGRSHDLMIESLDQEDTSAEPDRAEIEAEVAARREAISQLEELGGRYMTRNEYLKLTGTDVTDDQLEVITRLPMAVGLKLTQTPITDAGLVHVAKMVNVRELSINQTQITDAGLQHLVGLTELRSLDLRETGVTDAGLESLKQITRLRSVYFTKGAISEEGIAALQEALPNCLVSEN